MAVYPVFGGIEPESLPLVWLLNLMTAALGMQ